MKNTVATAWGKVIQQQRESVLGMSRAELGAHLGVTRHAVRLWETGEHAPSSSMQGLLIEKLGIDPATVADLIREAAA